MTIEKIEQLARIYNTLLLISTKGDDTVLMGDCLKALHSFIINEQELVKNQSQIKEEK